MAAIDYARWSDELQCWLVEDENGDFWEVAAVGGDALLVQREDSQRYYGAVFVRGSFNGYQADDIQDGFDDNRRYEFTESGGWQPLDEDDEDDEEGDGQLATTLTINGTVFDLPAGDETARLVAADALQEAGHEDAAAAMRAGFRVAPLLDGSYAVLDATDLEAQLRRLGVAATHDKPEGFCAAFEPDLPAGTVRVYDGIWSVYGHPSDFAAALENLDDSSGWEEVWAALTVAGYDRASGVVRVDFDARVAAEQVEDGTPDDNPWTLFTIASNAGVRYLAGPNGESACAIRDWYDNGNDLAETREKALADWGWDDEGGDQ